MACSLQYTANVNCSDDAGSYLQSCFGKSAEHMRGYNGALLKMRLLQAIISAKWIAGHYGFLSEFSIFGYPILFVHTIV